MKDNGLMDIHMEMENFILQMDHISRGHLSLERDNVKMDSLFILMVHSKGVKSKIQNLTELVSSNIKKMAWDIRVNGRMIYLMV